MIVRIIGYVLTVLFSAYLFFMYDGHIWTGLLILEMLYPLCSCIFLWNMGRNVTVRFGRFPAMAERTKRFKGTLVLKNHSRIWSVRYRIRAQVKNHFSKQAVLRLRKNSSASQKGLPLKYIRAELAPLEEQKLEIELDSQYAGTLEYRLESLILYDMLGIFCRTISLHERRTVGIMPPFELMPLEITRRTRDPLQMPTNILRKSKGMTPARSTRSGNTVPPIPSIPSTGS